MFNFVMTFVLLLGAIVGGGATTMAAAQGAQPDDFLYPVKTWTEDLHLGITANSQERLNLELRFSARRAEEIRNSLTAGTGVSKALLARYQDQLQQQLRLAVGLPADQVIAGLEQIRSQAQQQDQIMAQLHLQDQVAIQARDHIRLMLQSQELLAQGGIDNPDWLRQQVRTPDQIMSAPTASIPSALSTAGTGSPWTTGVPTPGSSYGPGTAQNPWTDTTPVPGSGYGPGSGQDCTPQPGNGGPPGQNGPDGGNGNRP